MPAWDDDDLLVEDPLTHISLIFADKAIVVTGAAKGIGRDVALRALAEGGRVLLVDPANFVADVAADAKGDAYAVSADLELYEGAEAAMRRSLFPTVWCCHAVLPHMLAQGAGTIINVSSNATRGIHRVPYSAAKGGVNALTQSLAMEYGDRGIRVATAPGGTRACIRRVPRNPSEDDEREQAWMAEAVTQVTQATFLKRYATMEEQVAPILFLASDEASYITGSILPVAGGDLG